MPLPLRVRILLNMLLTGDITPLEVPKSLLDCFRRDEFGAVEDIDSDKLLLYANERSARSQASTHVPRRPKVRRDYKESAWWMLYFVDDSYMTDPTKARVWRNRFRLPYSALKAFVAEARENAWFSCHGFERPDAVGVLGPPLELLVCVALRYMGRHAMLDDMFETSFISKDTSERFIWRFWQVVREHLYPRHVKMPSSNDDFAIIEAPFRERYLPGCIACIDCTHIPIMSKTGLIHSNTGKEGYPTRAYILAAGFDRRVIYTHPGKPGAWSDSMHAHFDDILHQAQANTLAPDFKWKSLDENGEEHEGAGVWFLVDGGFMSWPCLICGYKITSDPAALRWSQWVESVRKCVECTFGILKQRWQILKTGFRMHSSDHLDNCWFACCALHNMILDIDQQAAEDFGLVEDDDGDLPVGVKNILGDNAPEERRREAPPPGDIDAAFTARRQKLITHFDYFYRQNQVKW